MASVNVLGRDIIFYRGFYVWKPGRYRFASEKKPRLSKVPARYKEVTPALVRREKYDFVSPVEREFTTVSEAKDYIDMFLY